MSDKLYAAINSGHTFENLGVVSWHKKKESHILETISNEDKNNNFSTLN